MFLHVLFFSTVHLGYWALCMFPYTSSTLLCIDMFSDVWSSTPFPSCLTVYQTLLKPSVRTWSRRAAGKDATLSRVGLSTYLIVEIPAQTWSSVESFTLEVIYSSSWLWFSFFKIDRWHDGTLARSFELVEPKWLFECLKHMWLPHLQAMHAIDTWTNECGSADSWQPQFSPKMFVFC